MKRILSKILLICAVCISLVAGNAQTANAEPPIKFYFCTANTEHTLIANAGDVCVFSPSESVTKVTFTFTNQDLYRTAKLDIQSPAHFACKQGTATIEYGTPINVDCSRTSGQPASITVQFDTLNLAASAKVKMNNYKSPPPTPTK